MLTFSEKKYSQIEREALGIVFLDLPPVSQAWPPHIFNDGLTLSGYCYTIQYNPTAQHGNVDALSRLPQATDTDALCLEQDACVCCTESCEKLSITAKDIHQDPSFESGSALHCT